MKMLIMLLVNKTAMENAVREYGYTKLTGMIQDAYDTASSDEMADLCAALMDTLNQLHERDVMLFREWSSKAICVLR